MEKNTGDDRSDERDSKIVIKLKIPKATSEDVTGIVPKTTTNEGRKVCSECNREFSSGKALGGHMRVHVQASNKNPNFLKPPKTSKLRKTLNQDSNNDDSDRKPYYMNSVNEEGVPTCSQCGKTFPSMKSLFGHMRCHPERVWRGILPPPYASNSASVRRRKLVNRKPNSSPSGSSSSLSENGLKIHDDSGGGGDKVVDLTVFLRGWGVREPRGRRAVMAADQDDEVFLGAVEDLMSLANGGASMAESSGLTNKIDENSPSINLRFIEYMAGKGKAVMEEETETKLPAKLDFSDSETDSENTNEQLHINYKLKNDEFNSPYKSPTIVKKRKKMKLMMELEEHDVVTVIHGGASLLPEQQQQQQQEQQPPVVSDQCKYKCTTCNKCFTSHQALGGHRSSHNKSKLPLTSEEPDCKSLLMNLPVENSEKEVPFSGGFAAHQCKICDKIFATGQALGGHQRCHWTGTTAAQAPSSQITSTGTGGDRKVHDFDLNELPAAMMEEDEAANGNGYAISCYNSNMC